MKDPKNGRPARKGTLQYVPEEPRPLPTSTARSVAEVCSACKGFAVGLKLALYRGH